MSRASRVLACGGVFLATACGGSASTDGSPATAGASFTSEPTASGAAGAPSTEAGGATVTTTGTGGAPATTGGTVGIGTSGMSSTGGTSMTGGATGMTGGATMVGTSGTSGTASGASTGALQQVVEPSSEDVAQARAQRTAFHESAPERYVVKVTTNTGRADMAAVVAGDVVSSQWRLGATWEDSPLTNPLDSLFDFCPENASVGGCLATGCDIDEEYGYATNALAACPSEGAYQWVSCFAPDTTDLETCRDTPEPDPLTR